MKVKVDTKVVLQANCFPKNQEIHRGNRGNRIFLFSCNFPCKNYLKITKSEISMHLKNIL